MYESFIPKILRISYRTKIDWRENDANRIPLANTLHWYDIIFLKKHIVLCEQVSPKKKVSNNFHYIQLQNGKFPLLEPIACVNR